MATNYRVFFASSFRLDDERKAFEIALSRLNDEWTKKSAYLECVIWEKLDAGNDPIRKQNFYNQQLETCDILVFAYWSELGKFTSEEYEYAASLFQNNKLPHIYIFKKTTTADFTLNEDSRNKLVDLEKVLYARDKEQWPWEFENVDAFIHKITGDIRSLFDNPAYPHFSYGEPAKRLSNNAASKPGVFFGREDELNHIRELLKPGGQLMLINAEGGIGKTTLAAQFLHSSMYDYENYAWLFCENGILNAMKELATGLELDLSNMDEQQQLQVLKHALSKVQDNFLLILDNANDENEIRNFTHEFEGFHWDVLITSRCKDILEPTQEFRITHLPPELAKALFKKYYNENTPEFDKLLDGFLTAIECHTLLVEIFAKNLLEASELGMDMTQFLTQFETKGLYLEDESFEIRTAFTSKTGREVRTDDILDILYDFSKLPEDQRYWLVNIALLPVEDYRLDFLISLLTPPDKLIFRNILKSLFKKGWINGSNQTYRISPVVKELILKKHEATRWKDATTLVSNLIDFLQYKTGQDNLTSKFKWIPYALPLTTYLQDCSEDLYSGFLNELALALKVLGGYQNLLKAKELLELSISIRLKNLGENNSKVADSRSNLALVLQDLGGERNLLQANDLLQLALLSDIQNFGENAHPVSIKRSNLATVLLALGGYENLLRAKELLELSLHSRIQNFGENAPTVSVGRSNLAMTLQDIGGNDNLLKARELLELALIADIQNLGENAPSVSLRRSNLAVVLMSIGGEQNLRRAQELIELSLISDLQNFGENSPSVALRRSTLAQTLQRLGGEQNLLQASELMEMALSSDIQNFGENPPTVAFTRAIFGLILQDIGGEQNLLRAKELMELALYSDIQNFGESNLKVIRGRWNLFLILKDLEMWVDGWDQIRLVYPLSKAYLHDDHPTKNDIRGWYHEFVNAGYQ